MTGRDELNRLYRDKVLDHSRNPRNLRNLPDASHQATGHNPLCGDRITLYLRMDKDGRIGDVAYEAAGCAISMASASMLTERVRGTDAAAARKLVLDVEALLAGDQGEGRLGDIDALSGVRAYPSRVRCATLPWRTLDAALRGETALISTETIAN